ncbi:MAG: epoxyqueuosine reductase [Candidatus Aminicenantes bacterium]|nr:epoxyqueuosine reductase [Candidatus Aminicenantes bacterium]
MSDLAPRALWAELREYSLSLGFSLYGVADASPARDTFLLAEPLRERFGLAVVMGKKLIDGVLEDIVDKPTPLYFHHYRQVNAFLDRGALQMAAKIEENGYDALPIAASQIIDWKNQRAHVSHKELGRLAGLGWIGRNNLLVHPELGSRFRLVSVLTDMPLPVDEPMTGSCGTCRACIPVCPAGAIGEKPEDFDHRKCYEKLDEFRRNRFVSQHICGVCVMACREPEGGTEAENQMRGR